MTERSELPAGDFSAWLADFRSAQRGETDADVPCDGCTACCTASQFVHIGPDETATLAHIPPELLAPAPGMAAGHVVLGYDEHGRCPMLGDEGCTIYEHRPKVCRAFDCRVFAAAGVEADGERAGELARRVQRWRFSHPTPADRFRHEAVRVAARAVNGDELLRAEGLRPRRAADLAVLAVAVHDTFLDVDDDGVRGVRDPGPAAVRVAVRAADKSRSERRPRA